MRFAVVAVALLVPVAAVAQDADAPDEAPGAAAPPVECDVAFPPAPSPPPPNEGDVAFGGFVFFTAPPFVPETLPRNVEVRFGGSVGDVAAGFFDVAADVPVHVVGDEVVPDDGLWPQNSTLTVRLLPTATNPCQGCFGEQAVTFTTNDVVDTDAPVLDGGVIANGFVLPSIAEQQQCGQFNGNTHAIEVTLPTSEISFVTVGGRSARNGPTLLLRDQLVQGRASVSLSFGNTVVLSLREAVVLVVTARDLAGNVSPPVAVRLRMRSFKDRAQPDLTPLSCDLDARPAVHVPGRLPKNPSLTVLFPFEELPLALRPLDGQNGGQDVPLVPVTDVVDEARGGHVYGAAAPVDAGAYDVVGLACPHCTCATCSLPPRQRVVLDDVLDEAAPAAPIVKAVIDDAAPDVATGACVPDDAATLVVLAPAEDDVAGPADLVYDVVVSAGDGLPRPAGAALPALTRANGDVVVRVPTADFGRLTGSDFTMTLTARDVGGHTSKSTYVSTEDEGAGGCGGGGAACVVGVLVLLRRRRR